MNIEEAKAFQYSLAGSIAKLLATFTENTGLSVSSVEANRLGKLDSPYYTVEVEVKL